MEETKQVLPRPPSSPWATTHALAFGYQVGDQHALAVADLGADRHLDDGGLAGLAVALLARAVTAALALEVHLVAKVREVAELARGDDDDVAAGPAVTAVGPAFGHVLLAAKADRASSAAAAVHVDEGVIAQHDGSGLERPDARSTPRVRSR